MSWLPGGSPSVSGREPARFTKRFVDGLEPVAGRRIVIFDAALPGLCVRVSPTGLKVYALKYRNRFGRQRWLTIGHHGILSPDQARQQARKHLRQIAEGLDPAQDKADAARAVTIKQLSDRFLSDHVEVHNKHSTRRHVRGDLRNHILPAFGNRAVAELTTDEVASLHLSLRTTPIAANRLIRVLSKMMSQAELWGLRPPSPTHAAAFACTPSGSESASFRRRRSRGLGKRSAAAKGNASSILWQRTPFA